MKLSARNMLKGKVLQMTHGAINTEVVLEIAPGVEITSIITKRSAESLGLKEGAEAYGIIKASNIILATD